jgi:hypothetical protein
MLFADYVAGKTRKKTKTERGTRTKTATTRGRGRKATENSGAKAKTANDNPQPPAPLSPARQTTPKGRKRSNASADLLTAIPPLAPASVTIKKRSKTALFSEFVKTLVEKALNELIRT